MAKAANGQDKGGQQPGLGLPTAMAKDADGHGKDCQQTKSTCR